MTPRRVRLVFLSVSKTRAERRKGVSLSMKLFESLARDGAAEMNRMISPHLSRKGGCVEITCGEVD
jgi:hypothetical protein